MWESNDSCLSVYGSNLLVDDDFVCIIFDSGIRNVLSFFCFNLLEKSTSFKKIGRLLSKSPPIFLIVDFDVKIHTPAACSICVTFLKSRSKRNNSLEGGKFLYGV